MKLFSQVVRTVVNTALVPVAIARDAITLGGTLTGDNVDYRVEDTHTAKALDRVKREASEDSEE
jgi:hypothetical protein